MKQVLLGAGLLFLGLYFATLGQRPWLDYDFIATWYGLLLIIDAIIYQQTKQTIFLPVRSFLILAFSSAFFWLFYEWANFFVHNWVYPMEKLYTPMEWTLFTAIAFTTVLPLLLLCTRIASLLGKKKTNFSKTPLAPLPVISLGIVSIVLLGLAFTFPDYAFFLIWLVVFLFIDPLNARQKRPSLLVEATKKNFRPWLVLGLGSILAGLGWEIVNLFVHKWIYVLPMWLWQLPEPLTFKIVEMPIVGFLGYVPFTYSAFSVVTFLNLPIAWFVKKNQK